jgi:hypothetical protein
MRRLLGHLAVASRRVGFRVCVGGGCEMFEVWAS